MSSSQVLFEGEPHYVEGYVPSSLDSPHSSLQRSTTWIGMGFVLSAVAFAGIFVFGLATHMFGGQNLAMHYLWGGVIGTLACLIIGFGLIRVGRANYRAYKKSTGRLH